MNVSARTVANSRMVLIGHLSVKRFPSELVNTDNQAPLYSWACFFCTTSAPRKVLKNRCVYSQSEFSI